MQTNKQTTDDTERAVRNRLDTMMDSGGIIRFHLRETIRNQTVADHSWGVAMIISTLHPDPSAQLLQAALLHDVPEQWTGDVPWNAKKDYPFLAKCLNDIERDIEKVLKIDKILNTLTPSEQGWLKGADMLELLFYCMKEESLGNKNLNTIIRRGSDYLLQDPTTIPQQIRDYVQELEIYNI